MCTPYARVHRESVDKQGYWWELGEWAVSGVLEGRRVHRPNHPNQNGGSPPPSR